MIKVAAASARYPSAPRQQQSPHEIGGEGVVHDGLLGLVLWKAGPSLPVRRQAAAARDTATGARLRRRRRQEEKEQRLAGGSRARQHHHGLVVAGQDLGRADRGCVVWAFLTTSPHIHPTLVYELKQVIQPWVADCRWY